MKSRPVCAQFRGPCALYGKAPKAMQRGTSLFCCFFFRRSGHGLVLVTGSLHVCLPLPFWTTHQVKHYIRTTIPDYHQPPALPLPAASAASIAITITYLLNSKFQSSQVERRNSSCDCEVATAVGNAAAEHCHCQLPLPL